MASMHREYVLEVLSDQNFVRDIVKGKFCMEWGLSRILLGRRNITHDIFPAILSINSPGAVHANLCYVVQQYTNSGVSACATASNSRST